METPSNEIFQEMKQVANDIWNTYDNQYGYVDEKVSRINSIENIQDNAMVMYRMFDWMNQRKFRDMVSTDTLDYINNNE